MDLLTDGYGLEILKENIKTVVVSKLCSRKEPLQRRQPREHCFTTETMGMHPAKAAIPPEFKDKGISHQQQGG